MASVRRLYLTKSLFAKACECPRKLTYSLLNDVYGQPPVSGFQKSLAQSGQLIGLYSRLVLFPHGVEIPSNVPVDEQAARTERWIRGENNDNDADHGETAAPTAIFEGTVRSGPFLIRADVLEKNGPAALHLVEVKARSFDSRNPRALTDRDGQIHADCLKYLQDVAFQTFVLKLAFPDYTIRSSLVFVDKSVVNTRIPNLNRLWRPDAATGEMRVDQTIHDRLLAEASKDDIEKESLVTRLPVDDLVEAVLNTSTVDLPGETHPVPFRVAIQNFGDLIDQANEKGRDTLLQFPATAPLGRQCGTCEFDITEEEGTGQDNKRSGFKQCWKEGAGLDDTDDLVTTIFNGGALIGKLMKKQKWKFADVTADDIGLRGDGSDSKKKKQPGLTMKERQWLQVSKHPKVVVHEYLRGEMDRWKYPYHFVDFETALPVLPYTLGKRAFSTVAYQFSHHTLHEDGRVEHASEFLQTQPGVCPNQAFLDALAASLADGQGTVFRWGAYENTVLTFFSKESSKQGLTIPPIVESVIAGGERAMVDLAAVVKLGYYAPGSGASSSIKKLLLPTLRASPRLKHLYGQPTYNGRNFTNMQWWVESEEGNGEPKHPYTLLAEFVDTTGSSPLSIAQGSDAMVAYDMLQDDSLAPEVRSAIEAGLKRYCELDTLAMTMIVQALQDFCTDLPTARIEAW
jgi:hypothetical protein